VAVQLRKSSMTYLVVLVRGPPKTVRMFTGSLGLLR
jgi:hypothetical protein